MDSTEIQETARLIAEAHWKWAKECLVFFDGDMPATDVAQMIEKMEWAFVNAFIHGYKHGKMEENK